MALVAADTFGFLDGLTEAWTTFVRFIPQLFGAVVILLIGWIIARVVRTVVHRVLTAVKFDNLVDRSGIGIHLERAGYADSGALLAKIVYWFIMLIVIQAAVGALGIDSIKDLIDSFVAFLPRLVVALVLVVLTGAVANFVRDLVSSALTTASYGPLAARLASAAIWIIGLFAAVDQIGIATNIVNTLFTALSAALTLIFAIKFGVGGIASARDRFWPRVYDMFEADRVDRS